MNSRIRPTLALNYRVTPRYISRSWITLIGTLLDSRYPQSDSPEVSTGSTKSVTVINPQLKEEIDRLFIWLNAQLSPGPSFPWVVRHLPEYIVRSGDWIRLRLVKNRYYALDRWFLNATEPIIARWLWARVGPDFQLSHFWIPGLDISRLEANTGILPEDRTLDANQIRPAEVQGVSFRPLISARERLQAQVERAKSQGILGLCYRRGPNPDPLDLLARYTDQPMDCLEVGGYWVPGQHLARLEAGRSIRDEYARADLSR